jgi:gamma-glutamylcyclotransferase (GGCT)/AIG2-like uncharacterized protein YtfP
MTRLEDGSVLYATYGTLRSGWGNNRILCDENGEPRRGVKYLGIMKTKPSFTMYGKHSGFPVLSPRGHTAITVEIFQVSDTAIIRSVNSLEGYSGSRGSKHNWYDTMDIETPWGLANIFIQDSEGRSRDNVIESGDWNEGKGYRNKYTKSLEEAVK